MSARAREWLGTATVAGPRWRLTTRIAKALAIYLALLVFAALFLLPFYWMLSTAFKPQALVYRFPPDWFAGDLTLENFRVGWNSLPFARIYLNTLFVTVMTVFGTVFSSSVVGFGFARYRAPGSTALFVLVLATMMIPPTTTLIPRFVLFSKLGWIDSYLPLIVPAFFGSAFYIFLFRQFFRSIPQDYFDAAEVEGASPLQLYWRVAVPLSKPVFAAAALFSALTAWNDFLDPLVFLNTLDKFTLQLGLASFRAENWTALHLMMPMALLAMLPALLLVALGQRWISRSLSYEVEK
jgi:ABC-type glycerol-3-phosphate transport system permease component